MNSMSLCRGIYNLRFNVVSEYRRRDFSNIYCEYCKKDKMDSIEKKENLTNVQNIMKDICLAEIECIKRIVTIIDESNIHKNEIDDVFVEEPYMYNACDNKCNNKFLNLDDFDNFDKFDKFDNGDIVI